MPTCSAFPACGGCLYLDMAPESYLEKKYAFVQKAFLAHGVNHKIEQIIPVPFGCRRRATFAFKNGHIGFNETKSHKIIPLTACPALTDRLSNFLPTLKTLAADLKGSGDISVLETPFGIDMHILRPQSPLTLEKREMLALFAAKHNLARLMYNKEPIACQVNLPASADSFLQPSKEGEEILINLVLEHIGSVQSAVDLFCGAGTFTKPLLQKIKHVAGFDIAAESLAPLKPHASARDLFRNPLLAEELNAFELAVIDPPRAGADLQCRQLAQSTVQRVLMVSCNPQTAARDTQTLLAGGYQIQKIIPIDQFVYTNHIELFIFLSKA